MASQEAFASKKLPKKGRKLRLSAPRKVMCDMLSFAKKVPTVPVQRQMNLAEVVAARARLAPQAPGWFAIFLKAYAITAQRFPQLRRSYQPLPIGHIYEHPYSIATVAIEREYEDENAVFWAQIKQPDQLALGELQSRLKQLKDDPIKTISSFQRVLKLGRLPIFVRRLAFWLGLNFSGPQRVRRMGTFGASVYSSLGAESLHPISLTPTLVNYGPIAKDGSVTVRIVYDHRIVDGATVARALTCLEDVLHQEIVAELRQTAQVRAAA